MGHASRPAQNPQAQLRRLGHPTCRMPRGTAFLTAQAFSPVRFSPRPLAVPNRVPRDHAMRHRSCGCPILRGFLLRVGLFRRVAVPAPSAASASRGFFAAGMALWSPVERKNRTLKNQRVRHPQRSKSGRPAVVTRVTRSASQLVAGWREEASGPATSGTRTRAVAKTRATANRKKRRHSERSGGRLFPLVPLLRDGRHEVEESL